MAERERSNDRNAETVESRMPVRRKRSVLSTKSEAYNAVIGVYIVGVYIVDIYMYGVYVSWLST